MSGGGPAGGWLAEVRGGTVPARAAVVTTAVVTVPVASPAVAPAAVVAVTVAPSAVAAGVGPGVVQGPVVDARGMGPGRPEKRGTGYRSRVPRPRRVPGDARGPRGGPHHPAGDLELGLLRVAPSRVDFEAIRDRLAHGLADGPSGRAEPGAKSPGHDRQGGLGNGFDHVR